MNKHKKNNKKFLKIKIKTVLEVKKNKIKKSCKKDVKVQNKKNY